MTVATGPVFEEIRGRLEGSALDGQVICSWIRTNDGQQIALALPDRWRVEGPPIRIIDSSGAPRASDGDEVVARGQFAEVGASLCPGRNFQVDEVERIGSLTRSP